MDSGPSQICRLPSTEGRAELGPWRMRSSKARILGSACSCTPGSTCSFCQYNSLLNFPHLPDMVFPDNILSLNHSLGGRIEFTALGAMKHIDINRLPIQVSCALEWQESRSGTEQKIKPFDWTFTTDYKGTLYDGFELSPTDEKIDLEILKKKDKILFYEDIPLYEDELHDHGIASCSVKIRVMPSCWFVLLRYFLRVDDVLARINDTRMFYLLNSPHIVTEYTSREASLPELGLSPHIVIDPNVLAPHLPVTAQCSNIIVLPTHS